VPGRSDREILDAHGLGSLAKLALNESPLPPFPEVIAAIRGAGDGVNRYPDTTYTELGDALGRHLGVDPDMLWFGGGGSELLRDMALAVAGPGASVVFPDPSFVMYDVVATLSGAAALPVPLDGEHRIDIDGLIGAVRPDTSIIFVCNPNNPTGTHVPGSEVRRLLDTVAEDVLVVVDEAYLHFVAAGDYETMVPLIEHYPNLVVVHTFSKIYGLAGLRIGYAVGQPGLVADMRRVQIPFTVNVIAQTAALEALRHQDRVRERIQSNADGRARLVAGLAARGVTTADSQANFVYCSAGGDAASVADGLSRRGVIVRPAGRDWLRVSVGTFDEIDAFLAAYDALTYG
jgi:histidinol-phosphate aminotransferase